MRYFVQDQGMRPANGGMSITQRLDKIAIYG
jgi:hypothetical protein